MSYIQNTPDQSAAPSSPRTFAANTDLPKHAGAIIGRILARAPGWIDSVRRVAGVLGDLMGTRKPASRLPGDIRRLAGRYVAWPSTEMVAGEAEISERQAKRVLDKLEELGVVDVFVRTAPGRGRTSSAYVLNEAKCIALLQELEVGRLKRAEARKARRAGVTPMSPRRGDTHVTQTTSVGTTETEPAPAAPSRAENVARNGKAGSVLADGSDQSRRVSTPPPGSGRPPSPRARRAVYDRALAAWNARPQLGKLEGGAGRIGRALRPVVDACGAEATLDGFERYLDEVDRPSPNRFAETWRGWVPVQGAAA